MKKTFNILLLVIFSLAILSCGGGKAEENVSSVPPGKVEESASVVDITESPKDMEGLLANKGIGPVETIELAEKIDEDLAKEGEQIFNSYCIACHKIDEDFLGPAPKGILKRRSPEWVMNMILNTEEMNQKDSIAKELLNNSNGIVMVNMGLKEEQARAILEYFRKL